MKILKRIKLINWHKFINETINLSNSVLLSGENGAGKSTILDAIQLVLTCSTKNFNKAANEKGERSITSYVRCKTGSESRPYERKGSVTAHVALEFYDEERKKSFILGSVTDSSSETNEKTIWYRIDGNELREELFFFGKNPKKIDDFKKNKGIKYFNASEAKKNFRMAYGTIDNKFFELIPKAMAFKPIDDIKDFVYSYVLDKKEVNVEVLKENIRTYQDFELTLKTIKEKINYLTEIESNYESILALQKQQRKYEYYLNKINVLIEEANINNLNKSIFLAKEKLNGFESEETYIRNEKLNIETSKLDLEDELATNEDFRALNHINDEIQKEENYFGRLKIEKVDYDKAYRKVVKALSNITANFDGFPPAKECLDILESYDELLEEGPVKAAIDNFLKEKINVSEKLREEKFKVSMKKNTLQDKLTVVNEKIAQLEKKKLQYDPKVLQLIDELEKSFVKVDRTIEPRIFCELLTITDEKWKNAVEGYLNTQRFYIVVNPEDFDLAQRVYERVKKEKNIHSIGLVNTAKLEKYEDVYENTLASVVASKSHYARRFANMLLNKVTLCEDGENIKGHKCAITPSCMLYQNHVLRAIDPKNYKIPFIGENAYKIQLSQVKEEKLLIEAELESVKKSLNDIETKLKYLADDEDINYLKHNTDIVIKYKKAIDSIKALKASKNVLEKNNSFMEKKLLIDELKVKLNNVDKKLEKVIETKGKVKQSIEDYENRIISHKNTLTIFVEELELEFENIKDIAENIEKDFTQVIKDKALEKAREDIDKYKINLNTRIKNESENLREKQYEYKAKYDFGAEATLFGAKLFVNELNNLRNSEILSYEEKVQKARDNAEEEFKEQFLAKIKENIIKAKQEFKSLNKALEHITFGNERYEFKYVSSKRYNSYYKMIMDDMNMVEGFSLLSGQFNQEHKEVINDLFEKLTNNDLNSSKVLEEFTDYRTYMDYDIVIKNGDDITYYSKVSKEKSGGETQTPFYVTIAASFVQLYKNSINSSIGLIMFDEAFDKMDDQRINGVLEFLTKLPLQLIIAAPPEKIEYIGPMVDDILLVLKDKNISYVEEFIYE